LVIFLAFFFIFRCIFIIFLVFVFRCIFVIFLVFVFIFIFFSIIWDFVKTCHVWLDWPVFCPCIQVPLEGSKLFGCIGWVIQVNMFYQFRSHGYKHCNNIRFFKYDILTHVCLYQPPF